MECRFAHSIYADTHRSGIQSSIPRAIDTGTSVGSTF